MDQLWDVPRHGWPDNAAKLSALLDAVFAADWYNPLVEASGKPIGAALDPRRLYLSRESRTVDGARLAGLLLAVRGLQMQKTKGDPAVFVDHFAIALALAENIRRGATEPIAVNDIESTQLQALKHWMKNLSDRPDLLRRATGSLARYVVNLPSDHRAEELAEYLIARNSLARPDAWMGRPVGADGKGASTFVVALLAAACQTPWEKARQQRLLRAAYLGEESEAAARFDEMLPWFGWGAPMMYLARSKGNLFYRQADVRVAVLRLALWWYEAETGKPAERLEQLTPKYLPRIPEDPFDGKPFRYRLSKGEEIDWPEENRVVAGARPVDAKRKVPAGQGILWSVGPDRRNDGGKRQGRYVWEQPPGADLIYLVPLQAASGR